MKLLITGVNGRLGSKIFKISKHENYGIFRRNNPENKKNVFQADICDKKQLNELIEKIKPDWIVHCAAYTDVDGAEKNRLDTWNTNVAGTKNLVDLAKQNNIKFLYVSTDYVFDGENGNYTEEDIPNPASFYGLTKLIGEITVESLDDYIIVRTGTPFSSDSKNIVNWIIEKLKNENAVEIISDQSNCPTLYDELAECILKLIEMDVNGIFHAVGATKVSRYELALKVAKIFGLDEKRVFPVKSKDINFFRAKRPKDCSLNIDKVKNLGINFSSIDDALIKMRQKMKGL